MTESCDAGAGCCAPMDARDSHKQTRTQDTVAFIRTPLSNLSSITSIKPQHGLALTGTPSYNSQRFRCGIRSTGNLERTYEVHCSRCTRIELPGGWTSSDWSEHGFERAGYGFYGGVDPGYPGYGAAAG